MLCGKYAHDPNISIAAFGPGPSSWFIYFTIGQDQIVMAYDANFSCPSFPSPLKCSLFLHPDHMILVQNQTHPDSSNESSVHLSDRHDMFTMNSNSTYYVGHVGRFEASGKVINTS